MDPLQLGSGSNTEGKFKKFLTTPEGPWTIVPMVLIGLALFWFWGAIVPYVLATVGETLHLIAYCAILGLIGLLVLDKNVRNASWFAYRSVIRYLVGQFITIDPLGIQKTHLELLKEKQTEFDQSLGEVRGAALTAERDNAQTQKEYADSLSRAKATKGKTDWNSQRVYNVEASQLAALEEQLKNQKKRIEMYHFVIDVLSRTRDICEDRVKIIGREIKRREQDQRDAKSFQKAMRSIKGILNGMPGQDLYDESAKILEQRYTNTIGDLEQVLNTTGSLLASADVDASIARSMLDEKLAAIASAPTTQSQALMVAPQGELVSTRTEQKEPAPVLRSDDDFRNFFK